MGGAQNSSTSPTRSGSAKSSSRLSSSTRKLRMEVSPSSLGVTVGASVLDDLQEVLPHKDLAAAEDQEEDAGLGELIEHVLDLGGGHLALVVVVEITVHAALVAAVGDVDMNAEWDTSFMALSFISTS